LGKKITGGIPEDVLMAASEEVALKLGNRASAPYKKEAIKGVVTQAIKKAYGNE
jgi:CO/xanthine dehydrogenase FAD-binding subunit